jgi:septal ring factor EnvC (AmiA/AmiB activator)
LPDRSRLLTVTLLVAGLVLAVRAGAQTVDSEKLAEQAARQAEFDSITRAITIAEDRQAALKAEIASLAKDRAALNKNLINAGKRSKALEDEIGRTERRITQLKKKEDPLIKTLAERRAVLAEVLAALQRMGRRPPPAIVVRPEDALTSVRSAILLGAAVPELRTRAEAVAASLKELAEVRSKLDAEQARLKADAAQLVEERQRVALLIEERKKAEASSQQALQVERQTASELGRKASSLKELIDRLETEIAAAQAGTASPQPPASSGGPARFAPAIAFVDAKRTLPRPVSGVEIRGFGEDDGLGGTAQGLSIATRSAAQVISPADGSVVYAGPFRSYGQLLIVNCGDGYHVLLAGMERIDVEIGQFVLAGEPVAVMGEKRLASAGATGVGASQPLLYVEFRKDGTAVDPSPWWAGTDDEKVSG